MDKVYVVFGSCGEYSDWQMWAVSAYENKDVAEAHAEAANARVNELLKAYKDGEFRYRLPEGVENEYDPSMSWDYTGASYEVQEIPMNLWHRIKS